MAKSKSKKKVPKSKPAKRSAPKKAAKRGAPAKRGPRSQALPGMARARHVKLDNLCESIGEHLDAINRHTTDKKSDLQQALRYMQLSAPGVHQYTHSGVRISRNEGVDSITARKVKDEAEGAAAEAPRDPAQRVLGDAERTAEAPDAGAGGEDEELD